MTTPPDQPAPRIRSILADHRKQKTLTAGILVLCLGFAAATVYCAFCAFTWFKFALFDYGIYTNMIWNCGRGRLFLVLTTRSYLKTHLSFTLALLGPLYYLWDHPFLLSLLQWLMLLGGTAGLVLAGLRRKVAACLTMAVALFYIAYPLTQSVMLCEFHGVAGYLLLVPWLYYCLSFRKNAAWAPLLLLLGLREDAFLIAVPILGWFAIRDRSRAVWIMLAVSVAYGLLALFYLFPAVVGRSLMERRADCLPDGGLLQVFGPPRVLLAKLRALAWIALPALFFLRRGWPAILTFLSAPVITTLLSTFESQYELKLHYPAAMMACLGIALLEASPRNTDEDGPQQHSFPALLAVILLVIILGAHVYRGYLPLGGKHKMVYSRPNRDGLAALRAARKIPSDGILMTPDRLMPFCANRHAITKWQYLGRSERPRDLIFVGLLDLFGRKKKVFRELLASGDFGLRHLDSSHVLLVKDGDTKENAEILAAMADSARTVRFHTTLRHAGENVSVADGSSLRHWAPEGRSSGITLAYGLAVKLPPGEYEAAFRFRTGTPGNTTGVLSLHPHNKPDAIAQAGIAPAVDTEKEFTVQRLRFKLEQKTLVEPRVTSGDTELWLDRVDFTGMD